MFRAFDDEDRSVWMGVNELGGKLAVVISVCEQSKAEDAGFAAKTMAMTLGPWDTALLIAYKSPGCSRRMKPVRTGKRRPGRARRRGAELARTMLLKQRIREKLTTPA